VLVAQNFNDMLLLLFCAKYLNV